MSNNSSSPPGEPDHPDHHFLPPSPPSETDYRHARWPRFTLVDPPRAPSEQAEEAPGGDEPVPQRPPVRVTVVGVCSAGKSTLVRALKDAGYSARTVAQEHSYVPTLWQLGGSSDILVYLDASLSTIRQRGRRNWQQTMLDEEHRRLAHAREHCDLYVPTDELRPEQVVERVVAMLSGREKEGCSGRKDLGDMDERKIPDGRSGRRKTG